MFGSSLALKRSQNKVKRSENKVRSFSQWRPTQSLVWEYHGFIMPSSHLNIFEQANVTLEILVLQFGADSVLQMTSRSNNEHKNNAHS